MDHPIRKCDVTFCGAACESITKYMASLLGQGIGDDVVGMCQKESEYYKRVPNIRRSFTYATPDTVLNVINRQGVRQVNYIVLDELHPRV